MDGVYPGVYRVGYKGCTYRSPYTDRGKSGQERPKTGIKSVKAVKEWKSGVKAVRKAVRRRERKPTLAKNIKNWKRNQ